MERRPIQAREKKWAQKLAASLAASGITPNTISVLSSVFALMTALCFWSLTKHLSVPDFVFWLLAALTIQLRLLCNLFDGMVAVEHNKKSATGDLFNDIPDRISDTLVFCSTVFVMGSRPYSTELAFTAALLSVMTAYIRTLGASLGCGHHFLGPMAKPHRMATMTILCIIAAFGSNFIFEGLILINLGLLITCVRRVYKIASILRSQT